MGVSIKNIRDIPDPKDGLRYLIEQSLPEGVKEEELKLSGWLKNLAPSRELKALLSGKDDSSWREFRRLYYQELLDPSKEHDLYILTEKARYEEITLVFDGDDPERNHAVVLKTLIELRMRMDEDF